MDTKKDKIEKKSKKYIKKIVILLLCLCVILGIFFIVIHFRLIHKQNTIRGKNELQILQNSFNDNKTILNKLQNDNISLQNTTLSLTEKLELLQIELQSLKNYVYKLEQQNPVNNEKNLQVMILLNKIQKLYYTNKNFNEELEQLKTLTKNRNDLDELIIKLEEYKISKNDLKNITGTFKNEYKTKFLTVNKDKKENIFKEIITSNIKIRKINADNIGNGDKSVLIKQIEDCIFANDFVGVIDLIVKNNYDKSVFENTYNIAKRIVEFDVVVGKLMDLMINYL